MGEGVWGGESKTPDVGRVRRPKLKLITLQNLKKKTPMAQTQLVRGAVLKNGFRMGEGLRRREFDVHIKIVPWTQNKRGGVGGGGWGGGGGGGGGGCGCVVQGRGVPSSWSGKKFGWKYSVIKQCQSRTYIQRGQPTYAKKKNISSKKNHPRATGPGLNHASKLETFSRRDNRNPLRGKVKSISGKKGSNRIGSSQSV